MRPANGSNTEMKIFSFFFKIATFFQKNDIYKKNSEFIFVEMSYVTRGPPVASSWRSRNFPTLVMNGPY